MSATPQTAPPPVREVVVGVDGSPGAGAALDWALAEAGRRGVALRAVLAWEPARSLLGSDGAGRAELALRGVLSDAVAGATERTGVTDVPVTTALVEGHPVKTLVDLSGPAALLVTGARGRGPLRGLLLGSVSQSLAQYAAGPLVVVPPPESTPSPRSTPSPEPRVVVGVDGSTACLSALRFGADAAARLGARLDVVHAWVDTVSGYGGPPWASPRQTLEQQARAALDSALAALGPAPGVEVAPLLVEGLEYGALLDAALGAELLVVGARGRGGWKGLLLGSVGVHCVSAASCPVAVIRPTPGPPD